MTDGLAVEIGEAGLAHHRPGADGLEIVSIEGDVELAAGEVRAFGGIDQALQSVGQLDAAALDADEDELLGASASLDDLTRHARQRAAESAVVEKRRTGWH